MARDGLHAKHAPLPFQRAMHIVEVPSAPLARRAPNGRDADAASIAKGSAPAASQGASGASGAPAAPATASPPPTHASVAQAFVDRVVDHALGVDEKISQLNAAWPHIVATYQARVRAEVDDRALFLSRYDAAARGDAAGTTLAMGDAVPMRSSEVLSSLHR